MPSRPIADTAERIRKELPAVLFGRWFDPQRGPKPLKGKAVKCSDGGCWERSREFIHLAATSKRAARCMNRWDQIQVSVITLHDGLSERVEALEKDAGRLADAKTSEEKKPITADICGDLQIIGGELADFFGTVRSNSLECVDRPADAKKQRTDDAATADQAPPINEAESEETASLLRQMGNSLKPGTGNSLATALRKASRTLLSAHGQRTASKFQQLAREIRRLCRELANLSAGIQVRFGTYENVLGSVGTMLEEERTSLQEVAADILQQNRLMTRRLNLWRETERPPKQ